MSCSIVGRSHFYSFSNLQSAPTTNRRTAIWRFPRAAVIPSFHLPMRSYEVKNRTFAEDIKSLRLITAIKTPYLPDGRFDLEAYDALVNLQIENGTEGVIVGGTTGEGQLMSWDEHIMLIGHTVNCFGGSIKVIGNTGSNSTREAIHATEQGFAVGMHAALHINPYYGKTSIEGMISHFDSVLPMGPTIIYNVPSRTGQDIPPRVIQTLAKSPNLAGVKECVGNDRVKQYTSNGLVVWSGNDDECHDSRWYHGATGVISVTSNLVPGLMHELMFGGKNPALNSKLMPLVEWLFHEPNPIALNTALAQLGVVRPVFRLPYVPITKAKREEFVKIVEEIGRENFIGERDVQVLDDNDFVLVGMNYQTRMGMMAAGAYGLPQLRIRVFMWGALSPEKLPQYPLPTHKVIITEFESNTVAYDEGQELELKKELFLGGDNEPRDEMTYTDEPKSDFQHFIRLGRDGLS